MDHSGNRRLRAGADVSGGAGDGAGGGESSEEGRDDVRNPLSDELDIRIMAVVTHAVGDYGRHQRFDRAQHGNGEGWAEQAVNQIGAEVGNLQVRQAAGDSAEAGADGFHGKSEEVDG